MAQSIDTKIVELKFNNDNFADKVDSTLTKLEQLNEEIRTVGVKDAFKNLTKSAKDVDISHVSKGVEEASKGFSKMEVVGLTALANISNAAVNLGKRLVSNLVSPLTKGVMQGGLARARNIEQATFQFEGQKIGKSKGNESLSYYKEVMDAVLGTSYSYDVAAKAASQLAASNVGVEKSIRKVADGSQIEAKVLNSDMTKALLGIAGVASMTGSDFDSIAQIFTRVAGQGRVMANDLNSIASRGLNAAAVLASSLGKTEEEIREMVRKGEVDFEMFSKAMSDAFGSHAKDSTLMFQGAVDDVNAALARIGADFYGPALRAGRDVLNSITPVVDAIHNKLQPALDGTGNIMDRASKSLSQYLDMFAYLIEMYPKMDRTSMGDWIKEHMNAWTNISDLYKRGNITKAVQGLQEYSKTFRNMDGKPGIDAYQMIGDYLNIGTNAAVLGKYLDKTDAQIKEITKDGQIGAEDLRTVINGMMKDGTIGFNTFYKSFHKLWSESSDLMNIATINEDFTEYVRTCIRAEEPSDRFNKHLKTFASILNGAQSLFKSFTTILGGLADIFLTLASHLAPIGTLFVKVAQQAATFVVNVADFIATSESFSQILDGMIRIITKIFELVNVSKLAETALSGISKAFDFLAKAVETVQKGIATVITTISNIFGKIVDKIKTVISSTEELAHILQALKQAGIVVAIINIIGMLTKPAVLLDQLSKSVQNVGKSFSGMLKGIGDVLGSIAGLFGKIGAVIDEVRGALQKMQEVLVATALLEIGLAIMVLAGAFYMLSKIDSTNISKVAVAMVSFGTVAATLFGMSKMLSKLSSSRKLWEKSVNDIKSIGFAFLMFAASLAIMAAALYKLAQLDTDKLLTSLAAVEVLLITMAGIAKLLSGKTVQSTGLKSLWSGSKQTDTMTKGLLGLVAMAEAIKIVAKAITEIANATDQDAVWNAVAVVELIMWSMAAITKWLSATKPEKMTKGITSILAMALAIKMLTKPIIELSALAGSDNDAMWSAVGAVSALLVIMSILIKMLSGTKGLLKAGVSIIIVAEALKILGEVVQAFASLNAEAMWNAIAGITVSLIAMAAALALFDTKGLLAKVAAIYVITQALQVLSGVILEFGANNEQAWAGIGVAAIALVGLAGACALFSKVPVGGILKLFVTLALGAVLVAGFGAAIGVFGVGLSVFGVGLGILATGVAQISAVAGTLIGVMAGFAIAIGILTTVGWPAIAVILALSAGFLLLGAGMMMLGTGLSDTAAAIKILTQMKNELGDTTAKITEFIEKLKKMTGDADKIGESFLTIAKPLYSIKKSTLEISEQIDKLVGSYTELVAQSSDCITALATSLTTISKLNKDSFAEATQAIRDFLTGLKSINTDAETVAAASTSVSTSLETMKGTFDLVVESIGKFKSLSYQTFDDLAQSLNNIAEPITVLNGLRGELEGLSTDLQTFVTSLTTMKDNAQVVSEGATAISDALAQVGDAALQVRDGFSGMTQGMADIMTQIGNGLTSMGEGIASIAKNQSQLAAAATSIEDFYTKLSDLDGLAASISHGMKAVTGAISALGKAAQKTAALSKSGMMDSGSKMVDGLISGITHKETELKTKVEGMINKTMQAVKGKRKGWYDIGSYLIKGMISGISSQQSSLEKEVKELEAKAERAVRAKAKINSPSRVWMQIGSYMGEGLAVGISNSDSHVKQAAFGLASTSEDAVQSAISAISDAMTDDFDMNPKITPVVDLTNIRSASALANSAFTKSIFGTTGNGLAASITHTIQNRGKSNVEKSIDDLTDRIGDMTDTMNSRSLNNYIQIDGASDPEAFADGLIRSFRLNARTV